MITQNEVLKVGIDTVAYSIIAFATHHTGASVFKNISLEDALTFLGGDIATEVLKESETPFSLAVDFSDKLGETVGPVVFKVGVITLAMLVKNSFMHHGMKRIIGDIVNIGLSIPGATAIHYGTEKLEKKVRSKKKTLSN
jgi:hypothetical protein